MHMKVGDVYQCGGQKYEVVKVMKNKVVYKSLSSGDHYHERKDLFLKSSVKI